MKLKCKRRQHAQALVSFSPLSTSPFAFSVSRTHTRTHTWLAALFPHLFWLRSHFRFGKRRSNNSWHKLRLLQYTVTASKQTDSSTNGQSDRQAGQTSDCEGQQRPQSSFISRTLRHFDLHCKKELEASACVCACPVGVACRHLRQLFITK